MKQFVTLFIQTYILGFLIFLPASVLHAEKSGLFDLPFEQLMDVKVKVEVASLFEEDERVVGSSVSRVQQFPDRSETQQ